MAVSICKSFKLWFPLMWLMSYQPLLILSPHLISLTLPFFSRYHLLGTFREDVLARTGARGNGGVSNLPRWEQPSTRENLFIEFCTNDSSLIFLLNFESFFLDVYKPKVVGMMWSMLAQEQVSAEAGCIFINNNLILHIPHHTYSWSEVLYFCCLFRCS